MVKVMRMNRNEVINHKNPPNGWKDQIINAGIIAGLNFFTTLAGLQVTQVVANPVTALLSAGISAGLGFFTSLAIQRGLVKRNSKKK